MELLMTRYILEIMKDERLLKLYENGSWYPDFDKYRLFLKKYEKNNDSFSKLVRSYKLVRNNKQILESVASLELNSVADCLEKPSTKVILDYKNIKVSDNILPDISKYSYYISNGIYNNTPDLLLETYFNHGIFIVGVCDNINSVFYKENLDRLKELRDLLQKNLIPYEKIAHTNHRDKCIILTNKKINKER